MSEPEILFRDLGLFVDRGKTVPTPEALFRDLGLRERRETSWQELTQSDALFQALNQMVRANTFPDEALNWIKRCRKFAAPQSHWEIAYTLVWCAHQAATRPKFYRNEIDRVRFAIEIEDADLPAPNPIKGREKWAQDRIHMFLSTPVKTEPTRVAAALWRKAEKTGFVTTLELELLQPGDGQLLHHPADAFIASFEHDFEDAMFDAWEAAKKHAGTKETPLKVDGRWQVDGRWRLLQLDGKPLQEKVGGRSVSGAAAYGWYHALRGTVPDAELIVLAEIDAAGNLRHVDGVESKTQAIIDCKRSDTIVADCERFDTIVVADDRDKKEKDHNQVLAEKTLQRNGKFGSIRVVNLGEKKEPQVSFTAA